MTDPAEHKKLSERHAQAAKQPMYRGQEFELPHDDGAEVADNIRFPGRIEAADGPEGDGYDRDG